MKKTLIMTLALFVLFLLIGCDTDEGGKALTGTVTITGDPILGRKLSVNTKGVGGVNGRLSYQWKAASDSNTDGTDIFGETDSTYIPVAADIGKYITVTIGNTGNSSILTSSPVGPVVTEESTAELDAIEIPNLMYYFYQEIALPTTLGDLEVAWESSDPNYPVQGYPEGVTNTDVKRVKVRDNVDGDFSFILVAKIKKDDVAYQRTFPVTAREKNYYGYLLVNFNSNRVEGEQIRYALSTDGLNFVALNNNQPVLSSVNMARSGGVRDPYVVRGHDGVFRMTNTDMRSSLGWENNRGIVLSKSTNLINWTHSQIHFPDKFGGNFAQNKIMCVWAPETIYDRKTGKYLVHFAIAGTSNNPPQKMYYSWANDDFTDLTDTPAILYESPKKTAVIDLSIVNFNNAFHGVIKDEASTKGIYMLTSATLEGGYTIGNSRIDGESVDTEGAELYRLIGTDIWVNMYDCYTNERFGFKTSTNLNTWTAAEGSTKLENGNNFVPRHGSVIPITQEEYTTLKNNTVWENVVVKP